MTIDFDLLEATYEYVAAHPEAWNQADWQTECGTQFCFAGHAAILSGAETPIIMGSLGWFVNSDGSQARSYRDIPSEHVSDFAQVKLGLSTIQADVLFHAANNLEDLRQLINQLRDDPETSFSSESDERWDSL